MTDACPPRPWWKDAIFYQIYPRSFQDSNGDGIGDIPGIISRLDEIAALGVTALWLSPLYCSPDADNGYDIADYCDIDPRYGNLADFDHLVAEAAKREIKIIMDLIINHTSSEHRWFQASRRGEEPYRDYYIWREAKENGDPPNNWTSFFMGSTWEWDDQRQAYYLHLFDAQQPDLNYDNPAVIEEVKQVLRFWLDRGVAGFRCDVINLLHKTSFDDGRGGPILRGIEHYQTQLGTHRILQELRREVWEPYGAFTVGESFGVNLPEAQALTNPDPGELDVVFYFDHLEVDRIINRYGPKPFSAAKLMERLTTWQHGLDWNALYLENHDQPRIVSHYGDDKKYWARSANLLATMLLTLRGTPFLYQGQEIGMTNFDYTSFDQLDDVESFNVAALMKRFGLPRGLRWRLIRQASRDNARTPVQWDSWPGAGFTTGKPWLAINANATWLNYAAQDSDPHSVLNFYRRLIRLRRSCPTLLEGGFEPLYADRALMIYRRTPVDGSADPAYTIWLNFSGRTVKLPKAWLEASLTDARADAGPSCVVSNSGRHSLKGVLLPWEAVIIREGPPLAEGTEGTDES
ncbi:MAG: alpha-glucosidase [Propionibacteriaceae bacterium]|jgi:oligo-1,6-glucosidase|nr:alpha-glucosidase [Propionibacteriaceae bacterium]